MPEVIKVISGKRWKTIQLIPVGKGIGLKFPFDNYLKDEVKMSMDLVGNGWNPDKKCWVIKANSQRNDFVFAYLQGKNPYARYDVPFSPVETERPLFPYQKEGLGLVMQYHYCILAWEMGVGKTLIIIELLERAGITMDQAIYIAPKSAIFAVQREFRKWDAKIIPKFYTYDGLVELMKKWTPGRPAPRVVIYDESSLIKNGDCQRGEAAKHLADAIRSEWGDDGYVVEMTGTPAPHDPTDWWHQCEVACPGFLREGSAMKMRKNLGIVEMRDGATGTYPHLLGWKNSEDKCAKCGEPRGSKNHVAMTALSFMEGEFTKQHHDFEPSVNEVALLAKRLAGLVSVKYKKDCNLHLPEKIYEIIRVKPTASTLRVAKSVTESSTRAIQALTLVRELSDGFQYANEVTGHVPCPACDATGKKMQKMPINDVDESLITADLETADFIDVEADCPICDGTGQKPLTKRVTKEVPCPKDAVVKAFLEEYAEVGRVVIWAGFTGSIERVIKICQAQGWDTIRLDGEEFSFTHLSTDPFGNTDTGMTGPESLALMDASDKNRAALLEKYPRVAFIGNPKAGGKSLTLTASPLALYYSNPFDGEARQQSEDRIHRVGMDANRAARIVDIIHLRTDLLVLDNLKNKKSLQSMTMGELHDALEEPIDVTATYFNEGA